MNSSAFARAGGARRRRWLTGAFGGAVLVVTLCLVDAQALATQLRRTDLTWLAPHLLLHGLQLFLLGLRWSTISTHCGHTVTRARATLEYALSICLNQLLPSGMAGDGLRTFRTGSDSETRRPVIEGLVLDRVSGQVGLVLLVLVTLPFGPSELFAWRSLGLLTVGLAVCGLLGFRILPKLARRIPSSVRKSIRRSATLLFRPSYAWRHLSLSLVLALLLVAQFSIAARAVGVSLTLQEAAWLGPWVLVGANLPSLLGGWGAREGAAAALFVALGRPASSGVAVSVTFGLFSLVVSLPGLLVLLIPQPHPTPLASQVEVEKDV